MALAWDGVTSRRRRAGLPPTRPPDQHSQFKRWAGTVLGRDLATLLEAQGFLDPAWTEKRLEYGGYAGRPDGYTLAVPGGAIVEIKTVDDRAVKKQDMPEHYFWQGLWYPLASGLSPLPRLVVFMVGRSQGLSRHQVVALTPEWKFILETEMAVMQGAWEGYLATQQLPPCRHRFGWEDKWCPQGEVIPEKIDWAASDREAKAKGLAVGYQEEGRTG